jgi:hypothetical protein
MEGRVPRRNPAAFPVDDRRVYDAYIAGRQSAAIAAGVRAGLFDLFDAEGALGVEEVAHRMGWSVRGARSLLVALGAIGLVEPDGAEEIRGGPDERSAAGAVANTDVGKDRATARRFRLAPDAAAYLVRGKAGSLAGLVDLEVDGFLSPRALLDALAADRATVYGGEDPWEAHARDPEKARAFTAAMHAISERPAAGLAEIVELSGVTRLLDVGAGSGALSLALAARHPGLECTLYDLPAVGPIAAEYVREAGLGDRVTCAAGDMFRDEWPTGHDAVLLSQILHDWSFVTGATLSRKAFDALPQGGRVFVHEKLVDDDGRGPLANALVHLDMLVWTEGQQYTPRELEALLRGAGFTDVRRCATAGYWSLVEARKP